MLVIQVSKKMMWLSDIIMYVDGCRYASSVGTDAQKVTEEKPTVFLDFKDKNSDEIRLEVLREFGHVLGLYCEQQRPDYYNTMKKFCSDGRIKKQFRAEYPRAKDASNHVKNQYRLIPDAVVTSSYDPYSIMHLQ